MDVSDLAQTLYSREFRGCAVWKMLPEIGAESRWQGSGAGASDGLIRANSNSDVRMVPGSGDGGGFWIQGPCTFGRRGLVVSVGLLSFGLFHVVIGGHLLHRAVCRSFLCCYLVPKSDKLRS